MKEYRARYAGSWYPSIKKELNELLAKYFNAVEKLPVYNSKGIIAPHAGYAYSGQTAAYSFKAIEKSDFDLIVLLAPSHKRYLNEISGFDYDKIETPLGDISICKELYKTLPFNDVPLAYIGEHSFEIELPLLQYVTKGKKFKLLPLFVGDLAFDEFAKTAEVLKAALKNYKPLFIASSDFTHYGLSYNYLPFNKNIKENIKNLDFGAISLIEKNDPSRLFAYLEKTSATICGRNPILLLMYLLADQKATKLYYTTSGDMVGDFSNGSVSYVSMAFI